MNSPSDAPECAPDETAPDVEASAPETDDACILTTEADETEADEPAADEIAADEPEAVEGDAAEVAVESEPEPDPALLAALAELLLGAAEQARDAVTEHSGDTVGDYLGAELEDQTAATHRFLAQVPGYGGWQWAVVVAGYPGAQHVTVSEVVLVPGPGALLAPDWLPWDQRVRPGDLGPGDLLATPAGDPRLVPGYTLSGDPAVDETAPEFGFGRKQVLSPWGRADAAERWHDGDHGPNSAMARSTKRACRDCGYLVPLSGELGTLFGVCANEFAADGHVVDFGYGCGAHSDTPPAPGNGSPLFDPFDDGVLDISDNPASV